MPLNRYIYLHGHPDAATEVETIKGNVTDMSEGIFTDFLEFDNSPPINKYYYEIFTFSERKALSLIIISLGNIKRRASNPFTMATSSLKLSSLIIGRKG